MAVYAAIYVSVVDLKLTTLELTTMMYAHHEMMINMKVVTATVLTFIVNMQKLVS